MRYLSCLPQADVHEMGDHLMGMREHHEEEHEHDPEHEPGHEEEPEHDREHDPEHEDSHHGFGIYDGTGSNGMKVKGWNDWRDTTWR
jgi:hypothetical protein